LAPVAGAEEPAEESILSPAEAPFSSSFPGVDYVDDGQDIETDYAVADTPSQNQSGSGTNLSSAVTDEGSESRRAASSSGFGILAATITTVVILCLAAAAAAFVIGRLKRHNRASSGTAKSSNAADRPPGANKPAVLDQCSVE